MCTRLFGNKLLMRKLCMIWGSDIRDYVQFCIMGCGLHCCVQENIELRWRAPELPLDTEFCSETQIKWDEMWGHVSRIGRDGKWAKIVSWEDLTSCSLVNVTRLNGITSQKTVTFTIRTRRISAIRETREFGMGETGGLISNWNLLLTNRVWRSELNSTAGGFELWIPFSSFSWVL
jgi:hypothetical protein